LLTGLTSAILYLFYKKDIDLTKPENLAELKRWKRSTILQFSIPELCNVNEEESEALIRIIKNLRDLAFSMTIH